MTLDFYIDIDRQLRVKSFTDSGANPIPSFYLGDTITFRIWPLQPTGTLIPPFIWIPNTGKSISFAIGNSSSSLYVQQYTWTANPDPQNPYFTADVSFATTDLSTYLGGQTKTSNLEIKLIDTLPKNILRATVTLVPSIITGSSLTVSQGQTPASLEAVRAMLSNLVCDSITLRSPSRTHSEVLFIEDDGTTHDDVS